MKQEQPAYIVASHYHSFRPGESARIIDVVYYRPECDFEFRFCYKVVYSDFVEDLIPLSEVEKGHYALVGKPIL